MEANESTESADHLTSTVVESVQGIQANNGHEKKTIHNDPLSCGDSTPSSSSDANMQLTIVKTILDDPISSTSDSITNINEVNLTDTNFTGRNVGIEPSGSSTNELVADTDYFSSELNMESITTEKISEDVEDIANDLENLLGGTTENYGTSCLNSDTIGKNNDNKKDIDSSNIENFDKLLKGHVSKDDHIFYDKNEINSVKNAQDSNEQSQILDSLQKTDILGDNDNETQRLCEENAKDNKISDVISGTKTIEANVSIAKTDLCPISQTLETSENQAEASESIKTVNLIRSAEDISELKPENLITSNKKESTNKIIEAVESVEDITLEVIGETTKNVVENDNSKVVIAESENLETETAERTNEMEITQTETDQVVEVKTHKIEEKSTLEETNKCIDKTVEDSCPIEEIKTTNVEKNVNTNVASEDIGQNIDKSTETFSTSNTEIIERPVENLATTNTEDIFKENIIETVKNDVNIKENTEILKENLISTNSNQLPDSKSSSIESIEVKFPVSMSSSSVIEAKSPITDLSIVQAKSSITECPPIVEMKPHIIEPPAAQMDIQSIPGPSIEKDGAVLAITDTEMTEKSNEDTNIDNSKIYERTNQETKDERVSLIIDTKMTEIKNVDNSDTLKMIEKDHHTKEKEELSISGTDTTEITTENADYDTPRIKENEDQATKEEEISAVFDTEMTDIITEDTNFGKHDIAELEDQEKEKEGISSVIDSVMKEELNEDSNFDKPKIEEKKDQEMKEEERLNQHTKEEEKVSSIVETEITETTSKDTKIERKGNQETQAEESVSLINTEITGTTNENADVSKPKIEWKRDQKPKDTENISSLTDTVIIEDTNPNVSNVEGKEDQERKREAVLSITDTEMIHIVNDDINFDKPKTEEKAYQEKDKEGVSPIINTDIIERAKNIDKPKIEEKKDQEIKEIEGISSTIDTETDQEEHQETQQDGAASIIDTDLMKKTNDVIHTDKSKTEEGEDQGKKDGQKEVSSPIGTEIAGNSNGQSKTEQEEIRQMQEETEPIIDAEMAEKTEDTDFYEPKMEDAEQETNHEEVSKILPSIFEEDVTTDNPPTVSSIDTIMTRFNETRIEHQEQEINQEEIPGFIPYFGSNLASNSDKQVHRAFPDNVPEENIRDIEDIQEATLEETIVDSQTETFTNNEPTVSELVGSQTEIASSNLTMKEDAEMSKESTFKSAVSISSTVEVNISDINETNIEKIDDASKVEKLTSLTEMQKPSHEEQCQPNVQDVIKNLESSNEAMDTIVERLESSNDTIDTNTTPAGGLELNNKTIDTSATVVENLESNNEAVCTSAITVENLESNNKTLDKNATGMDNLESANEAMDTNIATVDTNIATIESLDSNTETRNTGATIIAAEEVEKYGRESNINEEATKDVLVEQISAMEVNKEDIQIEITDPIGDLEKTIIEKDERELSPTIEDNDAKTESETILQNDSTSSEIHIVTVNDSLEQPQKDVPISSTQILETNFGNISECPIEFQESQAVTILESQVKVHDQIDPKTSENISITLQENICEVKKPENINTDLSQKPMETDETIISSSGESSQNIDNTEIKEAYDQNIEEISSTPKYSSESVETMEINIQEGVSSTPKDASESVKTEAIPKDKTLLQKNVSSGTRADVESIIQEKVEEVSLESKETEFGDKGDSLKEVPELLMLQQPVQDFEEHTATQQMSTEREVPKYAIDANVVTSTVIETLIPNTTDGSSKLDMQDVVDDTEMENKGLVSTEERTEETPTEKFEMVVNELETQEDDEQSIAVANLMKSTGIDYEANDEEFVQEIQNEEMAADYNELGNELQYSDANRSTLDKEVDSIGANLLQISPNDNEVINEHIQNVDNLGQANIESSTLAISLEQVRKDDITFQDIEREKEMNEIKETNDAIASISTMDSHLDNMYSQPVVDLMLQDMDDQLQSVIFEPKPNAVIDMPNISEVDLDTTKTFESEHIDMILPGETSLINTNDIISQITEPENQNVIQFEQEVKLQEPVSDSRDLNDVIAREIESLLELQKQNLASDPADVLENKVQLDSCLQKVEDEIASNEAGFEVITQDFRLEDACMVEETKLAMSSKASTAELSPKTSVGEVSSSSFAKLPSTIVERDSRISSTESAELSTTNKLETPLVIEVGTSNADTEKEQSVSVDIPTSKYSSKMSENEDLKMTITKHKIESSVKVTESGETDDSILKIYDPKDTTSDNKKPKVKDTVVPKLIIKPIVRSPLSPTTSVKQVEETITEQTVPKLLIKNMSPNRPSSPKIVKTQKSELTSPLKLTIKPVLKPEESPSKSSPKLTIKPVIKSDDDCPSPSGPKITIKPILKPQEEEICHSPKITIKPIIKPDDGPSELVHSPRITIKPIPKPEEIEVQQNQSPRITIKPVVKPEERDAQEQEIIKKSSDDITDRSHSPRITIKPIVKPPEEHKSTNKDQKVKPDDIIKQDKKDGSPKVTIKPIVKPENDSENMELIDFEDQIKQERIVLKINKNSMSKDCRKRESTEDIEKLAKIKLKLSKEGGHAHIVSEQSKLKRALEESTDLDQKRPKFESDLTITPIDADTKKTERAIEIPKDDVKITPIDNSSTSKAVSMEDPLEKIPVFEITPETAMVMKNTAGPPTVQQVVTPTPRKRGRPRKVPLVVREEFNDVKEEEIQQQPTPEDTGRPKRSCRGPSVRTTLGIRTRKPRGAGRGRGRGRGRGLGSRGGRQQRLSAAKLKLLKEEAAAAIAEHSKHFDDHIEDGDVDMKLDNTIDNVATGSTDIALIEEETRMSADINNSRAQTPAKQIPTPGDIDDTQSSVQSTATTESTKARRGARVEVHPEPEGEVISADQLTEYYWGGGGPYMLQEQVAQFLGIKSFKRKYPGIQRRMVDMQERDFIRESGLVSEAMCDLGLTAVHSADILDIMYSDFQHKYEEYCKHQRDRQAKDFTNKQKALTLAASQEKTKQDITQQAVQSAASWNANFNKSRKEERKACMDLQTFTIHYPKGRFKPVENTNTGNYPVALVPGQYTDYYKTFNAHELSTLPINTVLDKPLNLPVDDDSQSESGSDTSSSSSDSDSSSSSSSDEDCTMCSPTSSNQSKKVLAN